MAHVVARIGLSAVLGLAATLPAQAHEVRPAYLELSALEADTWDLLWKVPAKGDLRLGLTPKAGRTILCGLEIIKKGLPLD